MFICYNLIGDLMEINVEKLLEVNLTDEVVIFETDTVYGIGCLVDSKKGVEKIYDIKRRDGNKPLAILCANEEQVKEIVVDYSLGEELGRLYWPGALTLILPKKNIIPDYITSGYNTVGVRIPNDEIALSILERFGPMAVTSLNLSTEPATLLYAEALKFDDKVDYLVKGKDLSGISSTVYDCVGKKVLRQGEVYIK